MANNKLKGMIFIKIRAFLFVLLALVLIFSACDSNNDDVSSLIQSAEDQASVQLQNEREQADALRAQIEDLESQIDELTSLLATMEDESDDLLNQIADLNALIDQKQAIIDEYANKAYYYTIKNYKIDDNTYVALEHKYSYDAVTITNSDGDTVEIVKDSFIRDFTVSPDKTRILIYSFETEGPGFVYLYSIETDDLELLDFSNLPRDYLPSFARWLDDRYFLFISQLDHGSVARGGDVYAYDTLSGEYYMIVESDDSNYQIARIDVYPEQVVVFTWYEIEIDDDFNNLIRYSYLTFEEVYFLTILG